MQFLRDVSQFVQAVLWMKAVGLDGDFKVGSKLCCKRELSVGKQTRIHVEFPRAFEHEVVVAFAF